MAIGAQALAKMTEPMDYFELAKQKVEKQNQITPEITPTERPILPPVDDRDDTQDDWRVMTLKNYFASHFTCASQVGTERDQVWAADRWEIDAFLLTALSIKEQECGSVWNYNNLWGWESGKKHFETITDGIYYVSQALGGDLGHPDGKYYDQCKQDVSCLLKVINKNPGYSERVMTIMDEIKSYK